MSSEAKSTTVWDVSFTFPKLDIMGQGQVNAADGHFDIVVANCTPPHHFESLWKCASIKLCADGGANRFVDYFRLKNIDYLSKECVPEYLVGDLDSVESSLLEKLESKGVRIVRKQSQDTTDLEKCLEVLTELRSKKQAEQEGDKRYHTLLVGCLGGNISQEMANYHCLYRFPHLNPVIVGDYVVAFLLNPGKHLIRHPVSSKSIKCGIIPLGAPCKSVTTSGLKWNLNGHELQFGKLISTSNQMLEDVQIETSDPVLWTFDLHDYARFL